MESAIREIILRALREDGIDQDITTNILVPRNQISDAFIIVKKEAILCGLDVAKTIFKRLDPKAEIQSPYHDGDKVPKNTKVLLLRGKTKALLSGERVALNFLSYLSGIATETHKFVEQIKPYKTDVMDTRKTIPGLRPLVKMAVRCGGGVNHRFSLKEMVMIKDNHRIAYHKDGSVRDAIYNVRRKTYKIIVAEVDDLNQFKEALGARPDIILLDNMNPKQLRKAVRLNKADNNPCILEASGGITLKNIRSIAKTGVDRISIGALTHSTKAVDFSMEFLG